MPEKILLVDDDIEFRLEMKEALGEYEVLEASSGKEALKILKRPNEIDLVMLDVIMPGESGIDVLRDMKLIAPELGIIILTGFSSKDVAIEALKGHADEYIEKPFDIEKTKEIIEKVILVKTGKSDKSAYRIEDKVEQVKLFIKKNFYKKLVLKDAATVVCLSPKYLSRVFRKKAGLGFSAYRLKFIVEKARELLSDTGYSVDQIADKLGYQNTESFIRIFEKIVKTTPSKFRRRHAKKTRRAIKRTKARNA
jgi:YesN/AraC family two-component response regulator